MLAEAAAAADGGDGGWDAGCVLERREARACVGIWTGESDNPGLSLLGGLREACANGLVADQTAADGDEPLAEAVTASESVGGRVLWEGGWLAGGCPVAVEYGGGEYGKEEPHPFEAAWWEAA
jgi:hypothetical protein